MNGGGRDAPPLLPPQSGGEFLLQLLHKKQPPNPQSHPSFHSHHFPNTSFKDSPPPLLIHDPAVAAVGLPSPFPPWQFNVPDFPPRVSSPHGLSSPFPPHFSGFPPNSPWSLSPPPPGFPCNIESNVAFSAPQFDVNQCRIVNGKGVAQSSGFSGMDGCGNSGNGIDCNIMFGSFPCEIRRNEDLSEVSKHSGSVYKQQHPEFPRVDSNMPPIGFSHNPSYQNRQREVRNLDDSRTHGRVFQHDVDNDVNASSELSLDVQKVKALTHEHIRNMNNSGDARGLSEQIDRPPPFTSEVEELNKKMINSLGFDDGSADNNGTRRRRHHPLDRDERLGSVEHNLLSQRMRILKSQQGCRGDINRLNVPFLEIYGSLIPSEEEKLKQRKLVSFLEIIACREWPGACLYLYGSCANSFGFLKSDIDVCLVIEDPDIVKSEVLLRLADILQSVHFENVQALTHARVPIVKLRDPETEIYCDICINNVLGVVNTKLLRNYAEIDLRLRQLAFIVKHWAKTRGVNETYKGTLSSYAYVIMCIHFLQQRRPAILPCLQGMKATYSVSVDDVHCCFFDEVDKLRDFGSRNKESIAQLVWAFFNYWAYHHDYANDVISVRTGGTISKRAKDWTRRIGNDRHLICIEDPFVLDHDLGRVVDKFSIKLLREEFERAAEIMQHHENPCVQLFQPYKIIHPSPSN